MSHGPGGRETLGGGLRDEMIGIAMAAAGTRATAARVAVSGRGLESRLQVCAGATVPVPDELVTLGQWLKSGQGDPQLAARMAVGLAQVAEDALREVVSPAELDRILAIGVQDPGLWQICDSGARDYLPSFDPATLAEATGVTVVDAFAARDLAKGGRGGPLDPLPLWMLLHDAKKTRVLLDLGRSTRVTYLPASCEASGAERVVAVEIGPGMRLLDRLTQKLTGGSQRFDSGGRLAVQGRPRGELIERLAAAPYFREPLPRYSPCGVSPEWFFDEAERLGRESSWPVVDLLCSATHFLAKIISECIQERIPRTPPLQQIVLTGGGVHNGLLLREISRRLPKLSLLPVAELGISGELLEAASVAGLAALHLHQVPATHTMLTGVASPRVLGRLTPGSPQNWRRVIRELSDNQPTMISLRSAI